MKLIVIDIDRIKVPKGICYCNKRLYNSIIKSINLEKVCTITKNDMGKKTLLGLPKGDPSCLIANKNYSDAIFKLKDDDQALKFENKMFRNLLKEGKISWFRIGIILRREKAIKILSRLLGIS